MHKNILGGRAPPGPAGGAYSLSRPLAAIGATSEGKGEERGLLIREGRKAEGLLISGDGREERGERNCLPKSS